MDHRQSLLSIACKITCTACLASASFKMSPFPQLFSICSSSGASSDVDHPRTTPDASSSLSNCRAQNNWTGFKHLFHVILYCHIIFDILMARRCQNCHLPSGLRRSKAMQSSTSRGTSCSWRNSHMWRRR